MTPSEPMEVENAGVANAALVDRSLRWLEALSPDDLLPLIPETVVGAGEARAACLLLVGTAQPGFRPVAQSGVEPGAAEAIAEALGSRPLLADQTGWYDLTVDSPAVEAAAERVDAYVLRSHGTVLGALAVIVNRGDRRPPLPAPVLRYATIAVSNALQFDELSRRSEGLSAITQLEDDIGLEIAFENVVARIITKLPTLLGATKAGVLLYDPATLKLRLQAPAFGFFEGEMVDRYQVTVDTGGAAWGVFSTGKPYLGNDCFSDPCCRQEIVSLFGLSKMICVPLARAGKRIGVVIVANRFDRDFNEEDVEVLEILSSHIGATLDNARLMEQETQRTAEVERLHAITKEQHDDLQRILDIHLKLNQSALAGAGIPGVGERLHRLIRRPLSVLDQFGSLIYRAAATAAETEVLAATEKQAQELGSRDDPDWRTGLRAGAEGAIIAAITGGDQRLGHLVIGPGGSALSRSDVTTIEYALGMFALEMLKQRAVVEVERRLQGEFITDLLTASADAASLVERGYRFGRDLTRPHWVVSIVPAEEVPLGPVIERMERCLSRVLPGGGVFPRGKGVVLLLPAAEERGRYSPPSLVLTRVELEKELGLRLLLGVGSVCTAVSDYPRVWREAELSIELGSRVTPRRSEFTFRDLGVYRLLSSVQDGEVLRAFRDDALGPLIDHDRQHNDSLVTTLAAFLASGGVLKTAAAYLGVHENTLRHRLDRVERILGVDLSRTGTRTELDLALKIQRTGPELVP